MTESTYSIRLAHWPQDREALRLVREKVFVEEQHVPLVLEWDGLDPQCLHLIAEDTDGNPIGTGRLLPDGHIGRMAVLREWRGRQVGATLLQRLVEEGQKRNFSTLVLGAQLQAIPFYEKAGFRAEGDVFADADIPHRNMVWRKR